MCIGLRVMHQQFLSDFHESYTVTFEFDVCVTVHYCYNNISSQADSTITNSIDNYNQLNMLRAIISSILRSTRLCLQLVV